MVLPLASVLVWMVTQIVAEEQVDLRAMASSSLSGNLPHEASLLRERVLVNGTLQSPYRLASRSFSYQKGQVYPWIVARGAWIHTGVLQRPRHFPWPHYSQTQDPMEATTEAPSSTEDSQQNATSAQPQHSLVDVTQNTTTTTATTTITTTEVEVTFATTIRPESPSDRVGGDLSAQRGTVDQPSSTAETFGSVEMIQEPVVMPVTEGKNRGGHDYGLPKELMPIHPGGGSKFDDLEKERLERAKMAQTKLDDDDLENGNSYDAEGLYSSASTQFISTHLLCFIICARLAL